MNRRVGNAVLKLAGGLLLALPLCAAVSIVNTSLDPAVVARSYSVNLNAAGGTAPYFWTVSGSVPPGLTLYSAGVISGVPTTAGSFQFTLTVADKLGFMASRSFTIFVTATSLTITTPTSLAAGSVGQSYSVSFTATGGAPPYRWTANTGLPAGLALNSQTGLLSGVPTADGIFSFTVQVADASQSGASVNFVLRIDRVPMSIATVPPLFTGTVGVSYAQPFSAAGGTPPYSWKILSGDTAGLELDTATGTLSGAPKAAGTFSFVIQATDSKGASASKSFSLVVGAPVLSIAASAAFAPGTVAVPYNQKLPVAAVGGTPPYRWTVAASVAPGLDFLPDTVTISGTPTLAGTFTVALQVTDSTGQKAARNFPLVVAPAGLTITGIRQLPDAVFNSPYSFSLAASGGAPPYRWAVVGLPSGLAVNAATGEITGTPTAAGSFPLAITVSDDALTRVSDRFTLAVGLPSLPAFVLSGLPEAAEPARQYPLRVALASAFPAPITGQAVLTFTPESGPLDRTVQFASGGTVAAFSIPAGGTLAVTDVPLAIQTGTVAGTINISLRLQAGGIDVTPASPPAMRTTISRGAPVITDVRVTRSEGKLELSVSGYSSAREVTQATFTFTAAAGQTLQSNVSSIPISVESLFAAWFENPASSAYGSQFVLLQPFTVQGDANGVAPQTVTLANRSGSVTYRLP